MCEITIGSSTTPRLTDKQKPLVCPDREREREIQKSLKMGKGFHRLAMTHSYACSPLLGLGKVMPGYVSACKFKICKIVAEVENSLPLRREG